MLKKILRIFIRDIKSTKREQIALYIVFAPILLAVAITLFAPGLNDTTVNLALLKSDEPAHIEYMQQFAKVELYDDLEALETRVNKRDDVVAIAPKGDGYEIVLQGNENEIVQTYSTMLNSLYEIGATPEDTSATIMSFGKTVPPLKTMLVNMLVSLTVMLAGMLIALSIVTEKAENTINALNVTPLSQTGFVIGKSMTGGLVSLVSIVIALFITGYSGVNWLMVILVGVTSMLLSLIIGFVQGLASSDVIEAATNVKMIFLPIAGSIVGYELLSDKWQWTMYWSPFYWAYKANDMILSKTADWPTVLLCTGMVLVLTLAVFFIARPKIRKGLS
ncbi:MAG: ABC transporter permease [Clostridia bacterium]|jgi:ABC-2 type transport system permease protein|nr:ABC transporter permease [Clostridia bacterium]MBT7122011.1 ABC transporter permease [Clostridia bacterium]